MPGMRSADFFRAKALWYRDLASREVGVDQAKLLATALEFDKKADHRAAREAAAAPRPRRRGIMLNLR